MTNDFNYFQKQYTIHTDNNGSLIVWNNQGLRVNTYLADTGDYYVAVSQRSGRVSYLNVSKIMKGTLELLSLPELRKISTEPLFEDVISVAEFIDYSPSAKYLGGNYRVAFFKKVSGNGTGIQYSYTKTLKAALRKRARYHPDSIFLDTPIDKA